MRPNQAADDWRLAEDAAKALTREAVVGDYLFRWGDAEPAEMVCDEARKLLRARGLALVTDDVGARVEAAK